MTSLDEELRGEALHTLFALSRMPHPSLRLAAVYGLSEHRDARHTVLQRLRELERDSHAQVRLAAGLVINGLT